MRFLNAKNVIYELKKKRDNLIKLENMKIGKYLKIKKNLWNLVVSKPEP